MGTKVALAEGGTAKVIAKEALKAENGDGFTTFNFAVEKKRTYFVGESALWVHNTGTVCQKLAVQFEHDLQEGRTAEEAYERVKAELKQLYLDDKISRAEHDKHLRDVYTEFADRFVAVNQKLGRAPSSKVLGDNLEIAGKVRPPNSAAHHLVAIKDERARVARAILKREGIDINEAANGVFLPRTLKYADPPAITHSTIHTDRYYRELTRRLRDAGIGTVRNVLRQIAAEILAGTFPY